MFVDDLLSGSVGDKGNKDDGVFHPESLPDELLLEDTESVSRSTSCLSAIEA